MADSKISGMTPATPLTGAELLETVQGGSTVRTSGTQLSRLARRGVYSLSAPATGFSVTVDPGTDALVLNPAGTLATGTVVFPLNPEDGDRLRIATTQTVTALTLTAGTGDTIVNPVTTLAANGFVQFLYQLSSRKWFRIG